MIKIMEGSCCVLWVVSSLKWNKKYERRNTSQVAGILVFLLSSRRFSQRLCMLHISESRFYYEYEYNNSISNFPVKLMAFHNLILLWKFWRCSSFLLVESFLLDHDLMLKLVFHMRICLRKHLGSSDETWTWGVVWYFKFPVATRRCLFVHDTRHLIKVWIRYWNFFLCFDD
jgi:hypothetical protein